MRNIFLFVFNEHEFQDVRSFPFHFANCVYNSKIKLTYSSPYCWTILSFEMVSTKAGLTWSYEHRCCGQQILRKMTLYKISFQARAQEINSRISLELVRGLAKVFSAQPTSHNLSHWLNMRLLSRCKNFSAPLHKIRVNLTMTTSEGLSLWNCAEDENYSRIITALTFISLAGKRKDLFLLKMPTVRVLLETP